MAQPGAPLSAGGTAAGPGPGQPPLATASVTDTQRTVVGARGCSGRRAEGLHPLCPEERLKRAVD